MIFRLPNGLPGYFIADRRGVSLNEIPVAKVKVRNGLSCMVCHDRGLVKVKNEWGDKKPAHIRALKELYPDDAAFGNLLDVDNKGIGEALRQTLQGFTDHEPLGIVSRRFRQEMSHLSPPSDVIPVNLDGQPRKPVFADATSNVGDRSSPIQLVTRGGAALIRPMPPLDASGPLQVEDKDAGVSFDVATINVTANKSATRFVGGDKMAIVVKNTGQKPMYFEVFMTNEFGDMRRLTFAEEGSRLGLRKPGEEYRFDFGGEAIEAPKPGELTKQRVIVYAAADKFPPGVLLNTPDKREPGYNVSGRVVHPLYQIDGKKIVVGFDPAKIVRKTIEFETLAK